MFESTPNLSDEINIVPDVPRDILHFPLPTVPVPTAAAALSPAPAATTVLVLMPNSFATWSQTVPIFLFDK